MPVFDKGDLVRFRAVFTDENDVTIDPSAVHLLTKDANGLTSTYVYGVDSTITRDDVGTYHADVSVTVTGPFYIRWESTGTGQAAEEAAYDVVSRFS